LKPATPTAEATFIEEVKSRQITFGYEVIETETGNLLASPRSQHICVDGQGKIAVIPVQWRQGWVGAIIGEEDGNNETTPT
jgi:acyl-CoA thioesterase FadM